MSHEDREDPITVGDLLYGVEVSAHALGVFLAKPDFYASVTAGHLHRTRRLVSCLRENLADTEPIEDAFERPARIEELTGADVAWLRLHRHWARTPLGQQAQREAEEQAQAEAQKEGPHPASGS